ncbi:hypothetical protein [Agaribacter flavus]|uniref:Uncharacterized protein n=1 Tax=Agaribacter flavus TaxID=1902781 RepID=A0ABV7FPF8_9ALTE
MRPNILLNTALKFFAASAVGYLVSCIFHTQIILSELSSLGIEITLRDQVKTHISDFVGLAPRYGTVLFLGFLLAFITTTLLIKKFAMPPLPLLALSGAVAVYVILLILQSLMDIALLASARNTLGIVMHCMSGSIAGISLYLFNKASYL